MLLHRVTSLLFLAALIIYGSVQANARLQVPRAESGDVAAVAARVLGEIGSKDSIPVLRRMLNHPSIVARSCAAEALGKLGDKDSIETLRDSLWLEKNDTPYDIAFPNIRFDGSPRIIFLIGGYRAMACRALRRLGDATTDRRFITILQDEKADYQKCREALCCLCQLGTDAGFEAICKIAEKDALDVAAFLDDYSCLRDGGYSSEHILEIRRLASQNENLSEKRREYYRRQVEFSLFTAKLEAAKTADGLKEIFENTGNYDKKIYVFSYMAKHDVTNIEDWLLGTLVKDIKSREGERGIAPNILGILAHRGSDKSLPVLETLLKDRELTTGQKVMVLRAKHGILERFHPDSSYLLMQKYGLSDLNFLFEIDSLRAAEFVLECDRMPRKDLEARLVDILIKQGGKDTKEYSWTARCIYVDTLLAWRSRGLVGVAVEILAKAGGWEDSRVVEQACRILRETGAGDKLDSLRKYYKRTGYDPNGIVTYTMYILGDRDVPKMLIAEAKAYKPEDRGLHDPYTKLLMYDDGEAQKFFFDTLLKDIPRFERTANYALYWSHRKDLGLNSPVRPNLALPALKQILMKSRRNPTRANVIHHISSFHGKGPEAGRIIQRYALHCVETCEKAGELIPMLADEKYEVRKEAREKLEKLGLDAVPALEEYRNHPDIELHAVVREMLNSYESCKTDF